MSTAPTPACPPASLLDRWHENADAWADAVRSGAIESRRLATDQAVVDAVLRRQPTRVLDVGCGEGWLARALQRQGLAVRGVEAVPRLVELAQSREPGDYAVATFAELHDSPLAAGFDLWVCNFSLFHEADAPALLAAAHRHLPPGGTVVIQTLHAAATPGGDAEPDGWQPGGWGAIGSGFGEPIPWYFRRLASWQALLQAHGFVGFEAAVPAHPATGQPLSWLLSARRDDAPA